jgi:hypothetical protein
MVGLPKNRVLVRVEVGFTVLAAGFAVTTATGAAPVQAYTGCPVYTPGGLQGVAINCTQPHVANAQTNNRRCDADSKTIYDVNYFWGDGDGQLELRYSPTCRTVWARTYNANVDEFTLVARTHKKGTPQSEFNADTHGYAPLARDGARAWTRQLSNADILGYAAIYMLHQGGARAWATTGSY